jgi:nitrous oxidase accessory protein NosD
VNALTRSESARPTATFCSTALASAITLALAISSIVADEGRTAIFQSTTITQSGSYILTADITVPGGTAITIAAPQVTLDLNGHTVAVASLTSPSNGILIDPNARDVRIENGKITGARTGISTQGDLRSIWINRVEFLDVSVDGVSLSNAAYAEVTGCSFHQTSSSTTTSTCIQDTGNTSSPFSSRVEDNTFDNCGSGVLFSSVPSVQVRDNTFSTSYGLGSGISEVCCAPFEGTTWLVTGNTISDLGPAITIYSPHSLIRQNVIRPSMGLTGIQQLGGESLVTDNVVTGGTGGIIVDGGRTLVEGNLAESATQPGLGCGLLFTGASSVANAYRDNMLRNNSFAAVGFALGASATDAGGNIQ